MINVGVKGKYALRCLIVAILVMLGLQGLALPASAQEIPVIHKGNTYTFYDSTAGDTSENDWSIFTEADFHLDSNKARSYASVINFSLGTSAWAWVGKTVQIADAATYRFEWWGHYGAAIDACGVATASFSMYVRVVDLTTNEIILDHLVDNRGIAAVCLPFIVDEEFYYSADISIPASRVNHQFSIQVRSWSYVDALAGAAESDAFELSPERGIWYNQIRVSTAPGGGGCVAKGTQILMPDTAYRPVEDLEAGDVILAYDLANETFVPSIIITLIMTDLESIVVINGGGKALEVSPYDQPVYARTASGTGWVTNPIELRVGDRIYDAQRDRWMRVNQIEVVSGIFTVYEIQNPPLNTFIAEPGYLLDAKLP